MIIDLVTIFPRYFDGALQWGLLARAREAHKVRINVHDLRDYTEDRHRVVDDYPYGGGAGMILKPEPFFRAVDCLLERDPVPEKVPVILLSPSGLRLGECWLQQHDTRRRLIVLCGHYEGVDHRVAQHLATVELSVGDYVLSGGEPAALVVIDALVRRLPGVLHNRYSLVEESFTDSTALEYPQYTRPADFRGLKVPEVLLSGNHQQIERWRREQAELKARRRIETEASSGVI
jgi:tRNA (guanine37-N1)-methyltransferase